MHALESVGPYNLLAEIHGRVLHDGNMVGIPTHATGHMEHKFRNIEEHRRHLV